MKTESPTVLSDPINSKSSRVDPSSVHERRHVRESRKVGVGARGVIAKFGSRAPCLAPTPRHSGIRSTSVVHQHRPSLLLGHKTICKTYRNITVLLLQRYSPAVSKDEYRCRDICSLFSPLRCIWQKTKTAIISIHVGSFEFDKRVSISQSTITAYACLKFWTRSGAKSTKRPDTVWGLRDLAWTVTSSLQRHYYVSNSSPSGKYHIIRLTNADSNHGLITSSLSVPRVLVDGTSLARKAWLWSIDPTYSAKWQPHSTNPVQK